MAEDRILQFTGPSLRFGSIDAVDSGLQQLFGFGLQQIELFAKRPVLDGFVGDTAKTYFVGTPNSTQVKNLVETTEKSLMAGIDAMKIGNRLGDIGLAVQSFAEAKGFGVVRDFVGHGIGRHMHEEPAVPNYGSKVFTESKRGYLL